MIRFIKGNHALVEGSIASGLDAYFGYPITPQNEITEQMSVRMREENRIFLQAESEIASINMVFGAALAGKKALTSSSSPGISLMQESVSYLVGCEMPVVLINVQRGGPGLGNIAGAQGDYFQSVKGGGHGDYKIIVLTPATVQEMYDMPAKAFELAFKYRNPVLILADGVLGQMSEKIETDENRVYSTDKGKDWALTGCRGRDSRFIRSLLIEDAQLEKHNYKLFEKFKRMRDELDWEEIDTDDADIILVGYGTSARINHDAYLKARERGWKVGYFRLKMVYPFPEKRLAELAEKSKFLVVEMSMGQMVEDVKLSTNCKNIVDFYGVPGGGIPDVNKILEKIEALL
ncbi:3-methyl-2-oxobutanoate dehydrogenase subunit VorB [bacterium]